MLAAILAILIVSLVVQVAIFVALAATHGAVSAKREGDEGLSRDSKIAVFQAGEDILGGQLVSTGADGKIYSRAAGQRKRRF